ncbi:MAG TPA: hypothetical protein VJB56_02565 [Candidatus Paceibacterota bacterium]
MKISPVHKELVVLSGLVFSSFLFWLSIQAYLPLPSWQVTSLFWSALFAFFLLTVFWSFAMVLVESKIMTVVSWALVSFMPVLWVMDPTMIVASAILFVFGFIAHIRGKSEMQSTLNGSLLRSLRKTIPLTVTFLVFAVAVASYIWSGQKTLSLEQLIPESMFTKLVGYIEPIISRQVPGFAKNKTFADYMLEEAAKELKKDPKLFTKEERALVIQGALQQFRDRYMLTVRPEDSLSHVLYLGSIELTKNQLGSADPRFFPILFAVGLFLGLRLLALPVYWLGMLAAILLVRILVKFGIVETRAITVDLIGYTFS